MSKLDKYMNGPVAALVAASTRPISEEEKERHRIYSLLLMCLVALNWNGNKRGVDPRLKPSLDKDYGINPLLSTTDNPVSRGKHFKNDYLGHNIAALAVDRDGYIIDFDFNHNEIFNSSIEHAEARLLHRIFKLNQIHDSWNVGPVSDSNGSYGELLQGVTIYTSLESCAQCSGIMTLGNAKEVIYLQEDPGQYKIGNIMFRLTESDDPTRKALAPRPIPVDMLGMSCHERLNQSFELYTKMSGNSSMTSFLCTEAAYLIFVSAEKELHDLSINGLGYSTWQPDILKDQKAKLDNKEVLDECLGFYKYVYTKGRRGTPH